MDSWNGSACYREGAVAWLAHAALRADHVATTEKDAVKLRDRWPASAPEPLVAMLDMEWEAGEDLMTQALDALVASLDPPPNPE